MSDRRTTETMSESKPVPLEAVLNDEGRFISATHENVLRTALGAVFQLVEAARGEGHRPVCAFCGGSFPDQHVEAWPEPNCACSIGKGRDACRIGAALARLTTATVPAEPEDPTDG